MFSVLHFSRSFFGSAFPAGARPQIDAVAPIGETSDGDNLSRASNRRPSATLAFVLMTQLQFLATLSLVDYAVSEDSWLADFVTGLRCEQQ